VGIVFGVARLAAQIESVPTMGFVGTVLTVQKIGLKEEPSSFFG